MVGVTYVTEVDPGALTAADWEQVTLTLSYIWSFFGATISAAVFFIIGHAVIPSLIITGHITARINRLRIVFYSFSTLFAIGSFWSMVNFINASEVLRNIYTHVWI